MPSDAKKKAGKKTGKGGKNDGAAAADAKFVNRRRRRSVQASPPDILDENSLRASGEMQRWESPAELRNGMHFFI